MLLHSNHRILLAFSCVLSCLNICISEEKTSNGFQYPENANLEMNVLHSKNEKHIVYRNSNKKECYIEPNTTKNIDGEHSRTLFVGNTKIDESSSKHKELGEDVIEFCKNHAILMLEENPPYYKKSNNEKARTTRRRRQVDNKKTHYRGQTQTQFLSFSKEGKDEAGGTAQAVAEPDKSSATVSGKIGMGQAQSQSGSGDACDECGISYRGGPSQQPAQYSPGQAQTIGTGAFNQPLTPSNAQYGTGTGTGLESKIQPTSGQSYPSTSSGSQYGPGFGQQGTGSLNQPSNGQVYQVPSLGGQYLPVAGQGGTSTVGQAGYGQGGTNLPNQPTYIQPYPSAPLSGNYLPGQGGTNLPNQPSQAYPSATTSGSHLPGQGGTNLPSQPTYSQAYPSTPSGGNYLPGQEGTNLPSQVYPSATTSGSYLPGQGGTRLPSQPTYGQAYPSTPSGGNYLPGQGGTNLLNQPVYSQTFPSAPLGGNYLPGQGGMNLPNQPTYSQTYPSSLTGSSYLPGQGGTNLPNQPTYSQTYPSTGQEPSGIGSSIPSTNNQPFPSINSISSIAQPSTVSQHPSGLVPGGQSQGIPSTGPTSIADHYPSSLVPGTVQSQGIPSSVQPSSAGHYPTNLVADGGQTRSNIPIVSSVPQTSSQFFPVQVPSINQGLGSPHYQLTSAPSSGVIPTTGTQQLPGQAPQVNVPSNIQTYPTTNGQHGTPAYGLPGQVPGGPYSVPSSVNLNPQIQIPAGSGQITGQSSPSQTNTGSGVTSPNSQYFPGNLGQGVGLPSGYNVPSQLSNQFPLPTYSQTNVPQNGQTVPYLPSGLSAGGTGTSTTSDFSQQGYLNKNQPQGIYPGSQWPGQTSAIPGYLQPQGGHSQNYIPTQQVNQNIPPSNYNPYLTGQGGNVIPGQGYYPGTGTSYAQPPNGASGPIAGGTLGTDISQGQQITRVDTESGESQSLSSINISGNETKAGSSAQGKTRNGVAQAQVSGTYTGSFSAQAQTSDNEKSAQSEIFGNSSGALSLSQGAAGKSQSQSQIQYSYESGASIAEAQGKGVNYGTNSQIQAGSQGGLADAQSTGSGNTYSQAQIGYLPLDETKEQKSIFEGGGTSSSQSGSLSGQSQIQYQGSFRYGPSFTGAAQSGAGTIFNGTKLVFNSTKIATLNKKDSKSESLRKEPTSELTVSTESSKQTTASVKEGVIKSTIPLSMLNKTEFDSEKESSDQQTQKPIHVKKPTQTQDAHIKSNKHDAYIYRDSSDNIYNPGDIIPGTNTKVPSGFRGKVASVAGDKTAVYSDPGGQAQTQTVVLKPGTGQVTISNPHKSFIQNDGSEYEKDPYRNYVTVTKSETGELNNGDRKYAHTYYTKSSTCGYFTFTCNLVNGSTGRAKICKPGPPTYSDGRPC